jgi:hypothetical protein
MLEIMQFYVSGFWTWAGITIAGAFLVRGLIALVAVVICSLKGTPLRFDYESLTHSAGKSEVDE